MGRIVREAHRARSPHARTGTPAHWSCRVAAGVGFEPTGLAPYGVQDRSVEPLRHPATAIVPRPARPVLGTALPLRDLRLVDSATRRAQARRCRNPNRTTVTMASRPLRLPFLALLSALLLAAALPAPSAAAGFGVRLEAGPHDRGHLRLGVASDVQPRGHPGLAGDRHGVDPERATRRRDVAAPDVGSRSLAAGFARAASRMSPPSSTRACSARGGPPRCAPARGSTTNSTPRGS